METADLLRARGLRVTAQRLAVHRAVRAAPHATADAVASSVRAEMGVVSLQAVYDTLAAFESVGIIRRIQPAGSPALFELRTGDNHHHLVCRSCGAVADVDCANQPAPCLSAADDLGYRIDEAEVVFWGRCPACLSQSNA